MKASSAVVASCPNKWQIIIFSPSNTICSSPNFSWQIGSLSKISWKTQNLRRYRFCWEKQLLINMKASLLVVASLHKWKIIIISPPQTICSYLKFPLTTISGKHTVCVVTCYVWLNTCWIQWEMKFERNTDLDLETTNYNLSKLNTEWELF